MKEKGRGFALCSEPQPLPGPFLKRKEEICQDKEFS